MAEAKKDPLLRQIALLQLIPRAPRRIDTTTLQEKLRDWGFEIDVRSLQRDLKRLVALDFPIERHDEERPIGEASRSLASSTCLDTTPPTALTLHLVESHLQLELTHYGGRVPV